MAGWKPPSYLTIPAIPGTGRLVTYMRHWRRQLQEAVKASRGSVGVVEDAAINSAVIHHLRVMELYAYLGDEGVKGRARFEAVRELGKAVEARGRAVASLGLGTDATSSTPDPWSALDSTPPDMQSGDASPQT